MKIRKNCIPGIIFELPYIAGFFPGYNRIAIHWIKIQPDLDGLWLSI